MCLQGLLVMSEITMAEEDASSGSKLSANNITATGVVYDPVISLHEGELSALAEEDASSGSKLSANNITATGVVYDPVISLHEGESSAQVSKQVWASTPTPVETGSDADAASPCRTTPVNTSYPQLSPCTPFSPVSTVDSPELKARRPSFDEMMASAFEPPTVNVPSPPKMRTEPCKEINNNISYSSASIPATGKDEDRCAAWSKGSRAAFAVFDGHGGDECAKACAALDDSGILPQLLERPGPLSTKDIEDVCWKADVAIGSRLAADECKAGSTMCLLVVEPKNLAETGYSSGMRCMLAWIGDSMGLCVDMHTRRTGTPVFVTDAHTPYVDREVRMLNLLHHSHAEYRKLKNQNYPAMNPATTGRLKVRRAFSLTSAHQLPSSHFSPKPWRRLPKVADVNTPGSTQAASIWRGLFNTSAQRRAQVAPDSEERNLAIPPVAKACIEQERLESALGLANRASPTLVRRNSFEMRNQSCPELRKQWSDIAAQASPKPHERRSSFETPTRLQSVGSDGSTGSASPGDRRRRNSLASFIPSCGANDEGEVGSSWRRRVMSFTGTDKLSKADRAALDALRDACKRDRKKEKKQPLEASEVDPVSRELVSAALAVVADGPTSPELVAHVVRAFERERVVFSKMKKGGRERRNSFVVQRSKAKDRNMPLVVATQQARDVVGYRDVMMTRSICGAHDLSEARDTISHAHALANAHAHARAYARVHAHMHMHVPCRLTSCVHLRMFRLVQIRMGVAAPRSSHVRADAWRAHACGHG